MALDVYIQPGPEIPPNRSVGEYIFSIEGSGRGENDGYFWFLFPLFNDLAKLTGQRIDLYGDAAFTGDALEALEQTLASARVLVDAQPDTWERVFKHHSKKTGWREERQLINKQQMIVLLEKLEGAVRKAKAAGRFVIFFGD